MSEHQVVIPTYNERENLGLLVQGLLALGIGTQIIVVDDNSPDGTGQLADELARQYPAVRVIHRLSKLGLGTAHIAGIKEALALGAGQIMTMDADLSHHPRYLPDLIAALDRVDVAIGSRYVQGGGMLYCSAPRRILSRSANLFAHVVLGLEATDATAGFRAYRREVLDSIALDGMVSNGYSFLIEMLYRCQQQGWRIGEVPIVFENRRRGASKISKAEIFRALQTVSRLARERLRAQ